MDIWVLKTQQWLNKTYTGKYGYNTIEENGQTGWDTIYALLRALQIEEGIAEPADNFGPSTERLFVNLKKQDPDEEPKNTIYILQGALWCKGYSPGGLTGNFFDGTESAVKKFQTDAGIEADGIVTAMIMKALLNMDAFVLVNNGDPNIRNIQQSLNHDYNEYFGLMPCDGHYSRDTNKALIYALQAEEGMDTNTANRYFSVGTTANCPTLSLNDSRTNFVRILQWSLYCNGYYDKDGIFDELFDGIFDSNLENYVKEFQKFVALPVTGIADMPTIKSLLSSSGDTNRKGTACDCATPITTETAQLLKKNGYKYVGRYITGTTKKLTAEEISIIYDAGLRIFPIYQTTANEVSYFSPEQGRLDASSAIRNAIEFKFQSNTTIYFAVDFDAYDYQVTENILPYFKAIYEAFQKNGIAHHMYKIGIYGARNICNRVREAGYSVSSFVSDMSTGFSGNLGFSLPVDWAFDQISTITLTDEESGVQIEIDNDIASEKDIGCGEINNSFDPQYARGLVLCEKDGEYYPIYVRPNMTTIIEPIYEVFDTVDYTIVEFDRIKYLSGLEIEENERQPIYAGNTMLTEVYNQFKLEEGNPEWSIACAACGMLTALNDALSNSYIRIIYEKSDQGSKRARIYSGFTDYEQLVKDMSIPVEISLVEATGGVVGEVIASNAIKDLYEELTGNESSDWGIYDLQTKLDPQRSNTKYCSQLWVDQNNRLMEYPLVFEGDKLSIMSYSAYPLGGEELYDLSYLMEGSIPASENAQKVFDIKDLGSILTPSES